MFKPRPFATVLTLATVLAGAGLTALPAQATDAAPFPAPAIRVSRPQAITPAAPTDQFIVGLKSRSGIASEAASTSQAAQHAATAIGIAAQYLRPTATGAQVVKTSKRLPAADADAFLAALRSSPDIAYAEPDVVLHTAAAPNDPGYPYQWPLWEDAAGIRAPGAWDLNRGEGAVVAVVDTGITSHTELNGNVLPGYDMISNPDWARDGDGRDANPRDEGDWTGAGECDAETPALTSSWHGTYVAGIIGGIGNNTDGITGVAPAAKILPIRAIGSCGGYADDVLAICRAGFRCRSVGVATRRHHGRAGVVGEVDGVLLGHGAGGGCAEAEVDHACAVGIGRHTGNGAAGCPDDRVRHVRGVAAAGADGANRQDFGCGRNARDAVGVVADAGDDACHVRAMPG